MLYARPGLTSDVLGVRPGLTSDVFWMSGHVSVGCQARFVLNGRPGLTSDYCRVSGQMCWVSGQVSHLTCFGCEARFVGCEARFVLNVSPGLCWM